MQKKKTTIALYLRLSKADSETRDNQNESTSIIGQRHYLHHFLDGHNTLKHYNRVEYIDDGFSGTNDQRPKFQELLEAIKHGEIQVVCTKDFTRISRDFLHIGYLMEKFFPLHDVRFLSISDHYDSDQKEETDNLSLKFRYVLSDFYSRDLSTKVNSAIKNRMQRGEYLSGFVIYGYKKDENNCLVIDSFVASHVQEIFCSYCQGMGMKDIAKLLSDEEIPTPSAYRKGSMDCHWSPHTIYKILGDERYTGTYIAGKTKKVRGLKNGQVLVPKTEWVIRKNHHAPIISQAIFDHAQKMKRTTKSEKTTEKLQLEREQVLLFGKVHCANCRRKMQRKGKNKFTYYCRYRKEAPCPCNGNKIKEALLTTLVYEKLVEKANEMAVESEKNDKTHATQNDNNYANLLLKKEKQALFEQFISKKISERAYAERKNGLETAPPLSATFPSPTANKPTLIDAIKGESSLTKNLVVHFIEAIFVSSDCVEVVFY
ncbi:MAG: recombinase family protein [Bacillota bacterium]